MKIYIWAENLYNVFTFTVLIPIVLGLIRWRLLTVSERWIAIFLISLLLHELLSILCIKLHTRNHFLYYIQTIAVLFSIAGVYEGTVGPKRLAWQIAVVITLLMIVEVITWVGFNHINSITLTISRLLPVVYAIFSLNRLFSPKITYSLRTNPMIYAHLGFFLFGMFTSFNAFFKSYFIENSLDLYYFFNTLSAMFSAVAFGLFSICFYRVRTLHTV